jgi:hypothetical protein
MIAWMDIFSDDSHDIIVLMIGMIIIGKMMAASITMFLTISVIMIATIFPHART